MCVHALVHGYTIRITHHNIIIYIMHGLKWEKIPEGTIIFLHIVLRVPYNIMSNV